MYNFIKMKLDVDLARAAFYGDIKLLDKAFLWRETPQGYAYWDARSRSGLDHEAKSILAFMVAQSIQFEIHGARAAA
jgi:hypothetical protein